MKAAWALPGCLAAALLAAAPARAEFRAGAAAIDVTPETLPVLVNGGILSRTVDQVKTRLHARAVVLSDGRSQVAIVVNDTCMMGRPLLDEAKALATKRTGIPADRILISATHTHTAPSVLACLGTEADTNYVPFLRDRLVEAIAAAQANLEPARIGFAVADAAGFTALRRWIRRPDRVAEDPFSNRTVRANMHAARNWDDVTGESGPEDPDLSLVSIQARDGRPIAVTECHNGCTREEQLRWFHEVWQAAEAARDAGIAVEAVTAWSLLGAFDWNSLLTLEAGHYEPGVFDVRSAPPRPTALARLLTDLSAGRAPGQAHLLAAPGWWQRPGRFLAGYGTDGQEPEICGPPILITGRNGTLAQALARACRRRGLAHMLLGRPELEIDQPDSIARMLQEVQPWAVINCAGIVCIDTAEADPELCRLVNGLAPGRLARACARAGVRFVQISSDQVFDGRRQAPYAEGDPTNALNAYGRAKAEAEDRVQSALESALVVRTAAFFSPDDRWNFAVQTLQRLAAGEAVVAASDQRVSPTYVPDLVDAMLDLLIDGEAGVWHLSNPGGTSWAEFARHVAREAGFGPDAVTDARGLSLGQSAPRPADVTLTSRRGLLLPPLADAVRRVFSSDELATRLSSGARKAAAARHSREQNSKDLMAIYRALAAAPERE